MWYTQDDLDTYIKYPEYKITKEKFDALPEYSMSIPTGDSPSLWKSRTPYNSPDHQCFWFVGGQKDGIVNFYRPVFD